MTGTDILMILAREYLLGFAIAFLIGGIPFGWLLARLWKHVDIREHGSGNIGATNAWRVLGPVGGSVVFLLDLAKGIAPVLLANLELANGDRLYDQMAAGLGAVLGHSYSPYLGFKGGRAVATGLGVFAAFSPLSALAAFVTWLVILTVCRYISVASVLGSFALAGYMLFVFPPAEGGQPLAGWLCLLGAVFVAWKHRPNFKRLAQGTEPRIRLWWSRRDSP